MQKPLDKVKARLVHRKLLSYQIKTSDNSLLSVELCTYVQYYILHMHTISRLELILHISLFSDFCLYVLQYACVIYVVEYKQYCYEEFAFWMIV